MKSGVSATSEASKASLHCFGHGGRMPHWPVLIALRLHASAMREHTVEGEAEQYN